MQAPLCARATASIFSAGGDPTLLGWGTTLAYLVGCACCLIAWFRLRRAPAATPGTHNLWLALGLLLLFLGGNKELDLQTLLIRGGGKTAQRIGVYGFKYGIELAFFLLVVASALAVVWWLRPRMKTFIRENPLAVAGLCSIALYVVIRFANIVHVEPKALASPHEAERLGFLELLGNGLVSVGALRAWASGGANRRARP